MQEYNNTILNLIEGKTCTQCKEIYPKSSFGKKTGSCKGCFSLMEKLKRKVSGKEINDQSLFCILPGYKYCNECKRILKTEEMNKKGCKDCKRKADLRYIKKNQEANKLKIIDYSSIKIVCCTCNIEKSGIDFAKSKSSSIGITRECKECKRKFDKIYRSKNKEKIAETKKRCQEKKPDLYKKKAAEWGQKNPEKRKEILKKFWKKKRLTKHGCIESRWAVGIKSCFKRNGTTSYKNWRKVLGYSPKELCDHLEKQFEPGMSWDLFINGKIHIDHIIPKGAFYYESVDDKEFKDCWALSNLRPVWNKENWSKNDLMPDGSGLRGRHIRKQKIKNLSEPDDISAYGKICSISEEDTLS